MTSTKLRWLAIGVPCALLGAWIFLGYLGSGIGHVDWFNQSIQVRSVGEIIFTERIPIGFDTAPREGNVIVGDGAYVTLVRRTLDRGLSCEDETGKRVPSTSTSSMIRSHSTTYCVHGPLSVAIYRLSTGNHPSYGFNESLSGGVPAAGASITVEYNDVVEPELSEER